MMRKETDEEGGESLNRVREKNTKKKISDQVKMRSRQFRTQSWVETDKNRR